MVWIFYIAVEPCARRLWPHMLVTWVRFVGGRWREPLVGRDIPVGVAEAAYSSHLAPFSFIQVTCCKRHCDEFFTFGEFWAMIEHSPFG